MRAISRLCAAIETQEAREALALLEEVTQQGPGNPTGDNQYMASSGIVDNIHNSTRPSGTSSSAALRRLRTHRPDLHARVNAGDLSPHAAMIEAGFRRRTAWGIHDCMGYP